MQCVLFDLDGTLVDSEQLGTQAIVDLLPASVESVESLTSRYRGVELAAILKDLEDRHQLSLGEDFVPKYRARMAELFDANLQAFPGADNMLANLQQAKCIASGGPPEKIQRSLRLTNLAKHFGDKIFSSYVINSWKPEPDLFLHAAEQMGFAPRDCVVIEDSEVGLEAALASGMRVVHFCPRPELAISGVQSVTKLASLIDLLKT